MELKAQHRFSSGSVQLVSFQFHCHDHLPQRSQEQSSQTQVEKGEMKYQWQHSTKQLAVELGMLDTKAINSGVFLYWLFQTCVLEGVPVLCRNPLLSSSLLQNGG